jgi:L-ribulose-5-phosphate 3-epimerase
MSKLADRLAVCSWSVQPSSPQELAARIEDIGIHRVQLALDPLRENPKLWDATEACFRDKGISVVSGMFGCVGEDYSTLQSIRDTGGLAPDSTWEQNRKNIRATVPIARRLGLKLLAFHAGFLPHDESDPNFGKMLGRLSEVADVFANAGMNLGLETGQETAPVLLEVLQKLNKKNVGVNFDPANMILYDKGNPIEALQVLGGWVRQVHIKDAVRTKVPGTWGAEVPVGTGQVDWRAFIDTLNAHNSTCDLVIEREAGQQRVADIRFARQTLERIAA